MAFLYKVNQLPPFRIALENFYGSDIPEIFLARVIYVILLSVLVIGSTESMRVLHGAADLATSKAGLTIFSFFFPFLSFFPIPFPSFICGTFCLLHSVALEIFCGTWLHTFLALCLLLTRAHNAALWVLMLFLFLSLRDLFRGLEISLWLKCLLLFGCGQASFFLLGNSNGISTVDLSGAYVGLTGYHVGLVGLLTFTITTAGPIFFHFTTLYIILDHSLRVHDGSKTSFATTILTSLTFTTSLTSVCYLFGASVYSVILMAMRNHLFIWTVFSPKFLYQLVWVGVALLNVVFSLVCGTLIFINRSKQI